MKKNYAQGSQDLPNDFGEDSHDSLVVFLKQNKPISPPPVANFETRLFAEISKYPQPSSQNKNLNRNLKRWLPWMLAIPLAIATGIGFNWVNNRSQHQVANSKISETEQAEIEQSLISSWNVTDQSVYQSVSNGEDIQLLSELSPIEYE
jgi:hypothetical protein